MALTGMQKFSDPNQERRILFVGANLNLAKEFRLAGESANNWTVCWARTATEARELLDTEVFSAVVAENQLSDQTGSNFLDLVMARHPQVTRILRFGLNAARENLDGVGQAYHLFREPCDASKLLRLLQEMDTVRQSLPNPALPALMAKMRRLPSPPNLYFQVASEAASPDASVERIGELIARDPAAAAKLLQLANSAAFGLHREVNHPAEAVSYLGFDLTKSFLLVVHSFSFFEAVPAVRACLEPFWGHALRVGRYARQIAKAETKGSELVSQAFTAGLLHDVGKLLFAANLPREFGETLSRAQIQKCRPWEIETQLLGASHAELGAYMLGIWNLPMPIVEAVAWHHSPGQFPSQPSSFAPLTAVHAANVLEHEQRAEPDQMLKPEFDLSYLERLGCASQLAEWRQICQPAAAD